MGKRGTVVSCIASLGLFALGATVGARRTRRRESRLTNTSETVVETQSRDTNTIPSTATPVENFSASSAVVVVAAAASAYATTTDSDKRLCRYHDNECNGECCDDGSRMVGQHSEESHESCATFGLSATAFDCPVCLGELVLPRVTPCGHTMCSTCLLALSDHDRRPACPVCRRRVRPSVERLPVNFLVRACVEDRVSRRGPHALAAYRNAERAARQRFGPPPSNDDSSTAASVASADASSSYSTDAYGSGSRSLARRLRPAWNWFKWSIIIVTEFGAFLVSLKEVIESASPRSPRYQRIV